MKKAPNAISWLLTLNKIGAGGVVAIAELGGSIVPPCKDGTLARQE
jgi:hypothetical protein